MIIEKNRFWRQLLLWFILFIPITIFGVEQTPAAIQKSGIKEKIGNQIPLNTYFTTSDRQQISLKNFFIDDQPVILQLAYFNCPMLCNLVIDGMIESLNQLGNKLDGKTKILTVSFDPSDTADKAKAFRQNAISKIQSNYVSDRWHFLIGKNLDIQKLASSLGFSYFFDQKTKEYSHPAVLFILTSEGKISRCLYGIKFNSSDLKLAIAEAGSKKIIPRTIDQALLFCYNYDPNSNRYVLQAGKLMRISAAITVALILALIIFLMKQTQQKAGML